MRRSTVLCTILSLMSLVPAVGSASTTQTLSNGQAVNLGVTASGDPAPDATTDLQATLSVSDGKFALVPINTGGWTYSFISYASSNLSDAMSKAYLTPPDGGVVLDVGPDEVLYVRTESNPGYKYFKLRANSNNSSSITIEWDYLGGGGLPPPTTAWSVDFTYDLFAFYQDESTGTPTSHSWDLGDGNGSSDADPSHHYSSAGNYNVCLTASNSGGNGAEVCHVVPITLRPSTTRGNGQSFDVDGDLTADILVTAGTCAGLSGLQTLGAAEHSPLNAQYMSTDASVIGGATFYTGAFCQDVTFLDTFLVSASSGAIYKAWMAANDGSTIRLEFAQLQAAPPTPPTSSFSAESYDLFGIFTDTSNESPSTWSWTFGDGATSAIQSPRHRYIGEGQRMVCLTASNVGGPGNQSCQNLAIARRPSTIVAQGGDFHLDADGVADLRVATASCSSGPSALEPRNGSLAASLGADYRSLSAATIPGAMFGAASFCAELDYLDAFLVQSSNGAIFKAWLAANDGSGIRLEYEQLQASPTPPPVSSFTHDTYDLFAFFTDTSTDAPASWDWDFGDGSGSSEQSPEHRYDNGGTRSTCLETSNSGGSGGLHCQDVSVVALPSLTGASGEGFDLDGDGSDDLSVQVLAPCLPLAFGMRPENGSRVALFDGNDYRNLSIADIDLQPYSSDDFCRPADFRKPLLVDLGGGTIYRAWVAGNDNTGIRLVTAPIGPSVFGSGFE